jgi:hypothetical protein
LAISGAEFELYGIDAVRVMAAAVPRDGIATIETAVLAPAARRNVVRRKNTEAIRFELSKQILRTGYGVDADPGQKMCDRATVQRPTERSGNLGADAGLS